MKVTKDMSASEINNELDKLDTKRSKLVDEFIKDGRGRETHDETMKKGDQLARKYQAIVNRVADLRWEISLRMGPGNYRRLPRGKMFGKRTY